MNTHVYSDFWVVDRGQLSLPGWKHKPYEPFEAVEPLPTPDELDAYARLPFVERQAVELALGGEVYTERRDMLDQQQERDTAKRARQREQQRAAWQYQQIPTFTYM